MSAKSKHTHDTAETEKTVAENEPQTVQSEVESAAPAESAPTPDPVAVLESEVKLWKEKYAYLAAEFDTFRRRASRDVQNARADGLADAVEPVLNIFDHFRMAMDASAKTDNVDKLREGLDLIFGEFQKAVKEMGIEMIEAAGTVFDPNLHEAISSVASDKPEGTVIQQWSCGYRHHGKLLRPARVIVSAGKTE